MKRCCKCKVEKPPEAFSVLRASADGLNYLCRKCDSARAKALWNKNLGENRKRNREKAARNYAKDPEKYRGMAARWVKRNPEKRAAIRRRAMLKRNYRLTEAGYAMLEQSQQGRCAICGRVRQRLFVDHCHVSDKVRGLLCGACNVALGFFQESERVMRNAIEYLRLAKNLPPPCGGK